MVPEQKPQSGLLEDEETQSGETGDKIPKEEPLGPYGELYDEYFRPDIYQLCAKTV
jgi:hypothetical protein